MVEEAPTSTTRMRRDGPPSSDLANGHFRTSAAASASAADGAATRLQPPIAAASASVPCASSAAPESAGSAGTAMESMEPSLAPLVSRILPRSAPSSPTLLNDLPPAASTSVMRAEPSSEAAVEYCQCREIGEAINAACGIRAKRPTSSAVAFALAVRPDTAASPRVRAPSMPKPHSEAVVWPPSSLRKISPVAST